MDAPVYINIALLYSAHQSEALLVVRRPTEKIAVLRERKETFGSPGNMLVMC